MAKEEAFVRRGSLIHHPETELSGFTSGSFIRMVLRNNWYEKPYPRPLSHGSSVWPWNGYIKWYDDRTPRRRQYTWFTDRPRDMWPDLNRVHIHTSYGRATTVFFCNSRRIHRTLATSRSMSITPVGNGAGNTGLGS